MNIYNDDIKAITQSHSADQGIVSLYELLLDVMVDSRAVYAALQGRTVPQRVIDIYDAFNGINSKATLNRFCALLNMSSSDDLLGYGATVQYHVPYSKPNYSNIKQALPKLSEVLNNAMYAKLLVALITTMGIANSELVNTNRIKSASSILI